MPETAAILVMLLVGPQADNAPLSQRVDAQSTAAPQRLPPAGPAPSVLPRPVPRARRFTRTAEASTVFDSNINHDREDLDSYGMVLGMGVGFRNDPRKPTFEVNYQAGFHRYANTDKWNRLSHYVRAAWDRRLTRRLAFETVSELSLKGSTEDQELSNQFVLSPRLEFRFTPALRVRGFGAWRVKRYDDTPDRNAFNRYAGLALVGRPAAGPRWEVGGRYELNEAEARRQRYVRWTWFAGIDAPLTERDRIQLDVRYRRQRYPDRLVDVKGGPDIPRRDVRIEPEVAWLHALDADRDLRLGYSFNGRDSNDPRRDYRSHALIFSIAQRW